jgi:hypothetical protein
MVQKGMGIYTQKNIERKKKVCLRIHLSAPIDNLFLIIVNNNNHPHTNLTITRVQRCTVNPAITALGAESRNPLDSRCHTAPLLHRLYEFIFDCVRTADSREEGRLEHAGDLERG